MIFIFFISALLAVIIADSNSSTSDLTSQWKSNSLDQYVDTLEHWDSVENQTRSLKAKLTWMEKNHNKRTLFESDSDTVMLIKNKDGRYYTLLTVFDENVFVQIDSGSPMSWIKKNLLPQIFRTESEMKLEGMDGRVYYPVTCRIGLTPIFSHKFFVPEKMPEYLSKIYEKEAGVLGLSFLPFGFKGSSFFRDMWLPANRQIFGLYLGRSMSDFSELKIGSFGHRIIRGKQVHYHSLSKRQRPYWGIEIHSIYVGKDTVLSSIPAIIDTGKVGIYGPNSQVKQIYDRIPFALPDVKNLGGYTMLCESPFPTLVTFNIDNVNYPIDFNDLFLGKKGESDENRCDGSIIGYNGDHNSVWHLGVAFLMNVYTVFDLVQERIGFVSLYNE